MSDDAAAEVEWEGKYHPRRHATGSWEYVERCGGVHAVVILAEHDGKVILIEQSRVPLGRRCLELPAGLVGDEDDKRRRGHRDQGAGGGNRLHRRADRAARRIFQLARDGRGELHAGPRAWPARIGEGGGNEHEEIEVHLVARAEIPAFVERSAPRASRSTSSCCCCLRPASSADAVHRPLTAVCRNWLPRSSGRNPLGPAQISVSGGV